MLFNTFQPLVPYKGNPSYSQWGQPQLNSEGQPLLRAMDEQPLGGGLMPTGGQPASGMWGPRGDISAMSQPGMSGNSGQPGALQASAYMNSLSPQAREARLTMLRQYNPGIDDSYLSALDNGDYDYSRGGGFAGGGGYNFQNYLQRAPTADDIRQQEFSRAQNSGGFWQEAGRPLLTSGIAAAATGGSSIAGQAAMGEPSTNNRQSPGAPTYSPYGGGNSGGNMNGGGLFDSLLGGLGNLSPAILAGYLGNQQRQDVMGQVGRLNTLGDSLSGPAFMNSITNPYDLQTGQGRTALTQNLQQRGVGGSSFGNQQLGNYDYMRGLGRGDLATRAQAGIAGTQGQLYSDALRGIVGGNAAYNQLLGGGLGASGSLFNRSGGSGSTGNGLFDWLRNLGGSPAVPGVPRSDTSIDPNTGLPANYTSDPSGQVDFGNDPSLATPFDPNVDWMNLYG